MPVQTVTRTHPYPPAVLSRVRRARCWRLTAWHEAGHAVAGLLVGRRVVAVELHPLGHPDGTLGRCVYARQRGDSDPAGWTPRRAMAAAVCGLAGGEAERLLVGRNSRHGRGRDDAGVADLALSRAGGCEAAAAAFLRQAEARTRELLAANRNAVGLVADALLASDRLALGGRHVRAVMILPPQAPPPAGSLSGPG